MLKKLNLIFLKNKNIFLLGISIFFIIIIGISIFMYSIINSFSLERIKAQISKSSTVVFEKDLLWEKHNNSYRAEIIDDQNTKITFNISKKEILYEVISSKDNLGIKTIPCIHISYLIPKKELKRVFNNLLKNSMQYTDQKVETHIKGNLYISYFYLNLEDNNINMTCRLFYI